MSGGRFDYKDGDLKSEIFGWHEPVKNVFEDWEISGLVYDVLDLIHEYDWYICGDTCRETYLIAKEKFKHKWLGDNDARVQRIIDERIDAVRSELYETFGVEVKHDD